MGDGNMRQEIKITTTLPGMDNHLSTLLINLVKDLAYIGWSINLDISEGGGGWVITGDKEIGLELPANPEEFYAQIRG